MFEIQREKKNYFTNVVTDINIKSHAHVFQVVSITAFNKRPLADHHVLRHDTIPKLDPGVEY